MNVKEGDFIMLKISVGMSLREIQIEKKKCPLCGVNEVPDMYQGRVMDVCPSCKDAIYRELFAVKMSFSDNGVLNNGRLINDLIGEWLEDQTD